ncbi:hypothetical protein ACFQPB_16960 [Hydrogenophaga atypica]|uniref:Uncharacterized protein n=1 Tax=Hydrogenophaga atypica TaxID=249409 RepID=A0ABW2QM95_9BURK
MSGFFACHWFDSHRLFGFVDCARLGRLGAARLLGLSVRDIQQGQGHKQSGTTHPFQRPTCCLHHAETLKVKFYVTEYTHEKKRKQYQLLAFTCSKRALRRGPNWLQFAPFW